MVERSHKALDIKLDELSGHFNQLQNHIMICRDGAHDDIRQQIIRATAECKEKKLLLENMGEKSRSEVSAKLAEAQLNYAKNIEDIMSREILDREETASLYAEYAIDFTIQSIQHTQLALLYATDQKLFNKK